MRRAIGWFSALMMCVCISAVAPAQEMLVNGGFESWDSDGIAQPWVYDGVGVGFTFPPDVYLGQRAMEFIKDGSTSTLTQSGLATLLDHEYLIGFWLYNDEGYAGGTKSFKATFDGTELDVSAGPTPGQWTYYSFYAYGTGNANASLEFEGRYDNGAWFLDEVSVFKTGEVIPEPAMVQLPMLLGLAGLTYWRRRRRA